MAARRYDSRTTIFSPEGRLYQVEYAMEAISNAGAAIGVLAKNGIVLASEKKISSKVVTPRRTATPDFVCLLELLDTTAVGVRREKMYQLDDHIACAVAGITADANIITNQCRIAAQRYLYAYQEPMPIEQLVRTICDTKQAYTQFGGQRPFGVSILYAGWYRPIDIACLRDVTFGVRDDVYGYQMYVSDPSGNYSGWKATAIGANHQAATNILKQDYKDAMTLDEAVALAIRVLSKSMDSSLSPEKVEMCTLARRDDTGKVSLARPTFSHSLENDVTAPLCLDRLQGLRGG